MAHFQFMADTDGEPANVIPSAAAGAGRGLQVPQGILALAGADDGAQAQIGENVSQWACVSFMTAKRDSAAAIESAISGR